MKKLMKMLSVIMVVALAFTSVSFANLSQVHAKSAVKSVKVKKVKKNLKLQVGDKKTFKVKVKAKKGKTKFKVKSSNKKVVSVKKKGKKITLTAKKAGKAKVTVRSKSNKKKKYVIKVTVTAKKKVKPTTKPATTTKTAEPTTKAVETTTAPVVPTTVEPTTAAPTVEPTTEEPTSVEPTTEAPTEEPTGVEPTTVAPTEEPTTEAPTEETTTPEETTEPEVYENSYKYTVNAGEDINEHIYAYGEEIISIDDLPETMTCQIKHETADDYLVFGGKLENTGKYDFTVKTKSLEGQFYIYDVSFYVVDEDTIFVEDMDTTEYVYSDDGISANWFFVPYVYGSGESYNFEIVSDPNEVFAVEDIEDDEGDLFTAITYNIEEAGVYTATVKAWDNDNPNAYTTFTVTVDAKNYCKVSGTVTSESGKAIEDAAVYFDYGLDYYDTYTDEDGEYAYYLIPSRYSIFAQYGDIYSETKNVNLTEDKEYNFTLGGLYEVNVTSDDINPDEFGAWEGKYTDDEGYEYTVEYGSGSQLFLAEGEYTLYTSGEAVIDNQLCSYDAEFTVDVTEDTEVKATITDSAPLPIQSKELALGDNSISIKIGSFKVYKFVAPATGTYAFTSDFDMENEEDPFARLYDADFNELDESDDIYYDPENPEDENTDLNFYLEADLEEGETYYVAVQKWDSFWGSDTARGNLSIEKLDD